MNVLGLFSGIGGFELGFQRAGFHIVGMCETEPFCRAVLRHHWPHVPVLGDVRGVTAELLDVLGIHPDVITGGFPCQDISHAGKRVGLSGARSGLWWQFHRILEEVRPRWAVIENVSALRGRGLGEVLGSLAAIGYDAEWHCIPAAAVGAPHERDRVWIVAHHHHLGHDRERQSGVLQALRHALGDDAHGRGGAVAAVAHAHRAARRAEHPAGAGGGEADASHLGPARASGDEFEPGLEGAAEPHEGRSEPALGFDPHHHHPDVEGRRVRRPAWGSAWWQAQPPVGGVVHGISGRLDRHRWMHRLHALGNSVVPQIPEIIARSILLTEMLS